MMSNLELFETTLDASNKCRKNYPYLEPVLDSLDLAISDFILVEKGQKIAEGKEAYEHFGLIFGRDVDPVDSELSGLVHLVQKVIRGYGDAPQHP